MKKKKYIMTAEMADTMRRYYDGNPENTDRIQRLFGTRFPRWWIKRQAQLMGLTRLPGKGPEWSDKEIDYLIEYYPKKNIDVIARNLKKINGGISRSRTAIMLKKKRIGLTKRGEGYTLGQFMEILGLQSHHTVTDWVRYGYLPAKRKNTQRTEANGGDMWHFEPEHIREFLINYPEKVDHRKIEFKTVIDILTGRL